MMCDGIQDEPFVFTDREKKAFCEFVRRHSDGSPQFVNEAADQTKAIPQKDVEGVRRGSTAASAVRLRPNSDPGFAPDVALGAPLDTDNPIVSSKNRLAHLLARRRQMIAQTLWLYTVRHGRPGDIGFAHARLKRFIAESYSEATKTGAGEWKPATSALRRALLSAQAAGEGRQ